MGRKKDMVGKTVGSYKILSRLGKGGMGEVYLAEHPVIKSRVAIKVLHRRFLTDGNVVKRFIDEARAVNTISHAGIVRIYDCRRLEGLGVYLVMELLEGESLLARMQKSDRQTPRFTARILMQICSALEVAHSADIIHRDLKPANIFLVPDEDLPAGVRAKVLDFGVAKLKHDPSQSEGGSTMTGAVFGSPRYMSPEQCLDTKNVDARSDIYSLGGIAYEMLCGRAPYEAETLGKLVLAHQTDTPRELCRLNRKVPRALSNVIMRAISTEPEHRFPDIGSLREALAAIEWVDEENVQAELDPDESTPVEVMEQKPTGEFTSPAHDLPAAETAEELADEDPADSLTPEPLADPDAETAPPTAPEQAEPGQPAPADDELEPDEAPLMEEPPDSDLDIKLDDAAWQRRRGGRARGGAFGGLRSLSRNLKRGRHAVFLALAAVMFLVGGGRLMGKALSEPLLRYGEHQKMPTMRGCLGVPELGQLDAPRMAWSKELPDGGKKGKKSKKSKKSKKGKKGKKASKAAAPAKGPAGGEEMLPVAGASDGASGCYRSSELLFLGLARYFGGDEDAMPPPRSLAMSRAVIMLLVVGLFTLFLAGWSPAAALANSLVFALVLTDPTSLLWLGTINLEFSHVLFLYLTIVLAIIVTQYSDRVGWHLLLCGALMGLGLTQVHHRYLPLVLGVLIFIQLSGTRQRKAGRALVLYLITGIVVLTLQTMAVGGQGPAAKLHKAGQTSLVLGALLPAFKDPGTGAEKLGLAPSCAPHAGVDGHAPDLSQRHPCPDALHMRRGKITGTLLSNPGAGWNLIARGLAHARPWISGELIGGGGPGTRPTGLSGLVEALPEGVFRVLLVLLFLGTLVAVGRILLSVFMGADPMGPVGVALLLSAAAGMEVFISSLFADGYVALDRHTHVMSTALMVGLALGLVALGGELLHRFKPDPYRR